VQIEDAKGIKDEAEENTKLVKDLNCFLGRNEYTGFLDLSNGRGSSE